MEELLRSVVTELLVSTFMSESNALSTVLLQSWARVEKPNLKTLVVLAPGCLSCLEYPADDHRVRVRVPVRSNIVPWSFRNEYIASIPFNVR